MVVNIKLNEYQPCHDVGKILNPEDLGRIENFLKKNHLQEAFKITPNSLQATSWVGVVKCGNFQVQVLPKLLASNAYDKETTILKNLVFMLAYTRNLEIKSLESSMLSKCENPFLEILIREFANSLFESLKKHSPKSYIRQEDNLGFLKGKLKISGHIRHNLTNQAHFYCEYDEFSEDNVLNQLFYYVATCLSNISKDNENKKILSLIKNFYSEISWVPFDKVKANKVKLYRNQLSFEKPLKLAKMFVENSSVDLTINKVKNIALLWDMNKLFEEFVFEIMRRYNKNGWKVVAQKGKKLLQQDNSKKRNTFVDIFAYKGNKRLILDTKYKTFEGLDSFSNSDVFQVTTYCLLHEAKKAILIYPQWTKEKLDIAPCNLNTPGDVKPYEIQFKTVNLMQDIKKNLSSIITEVNQILEDGTRQAEA